MGSSGVTTSFGSRFRRHDGLPHRAEGLDRREKYSDGWPSPTRHRLGRPFPLGHRFQPEAFFKHDTDTGEIVEKIQLADSDPLPHGMTSWQGPLWYCDDVGIVCRLKL